MDVLKAAIYMLVVMMSVNTISSMSTHVGISNNVAMNATDVNAAFNATNIVESWGWEDNQFYDIGTALVSFWYRTIPYIEAFPHMLAAYGCPNFIYVPVHNIWRFLWMTAVSLGIIGGRRT